LEIVAFVRYFTLGTNINRYLLYCKSIKSRPI
jgi:hypothetical protein